MYYIARQSFSIKASKRAALTRALQGEDGQQPHASLEEAMTSAGLLAAPNSGAITRLEADPDKEGLVGGALLPLMQRMAPFVHEGSWLVLLTPGTQTADTWRFGPGTASPGFSVSTLQPRADMWDNYACPRASAHARLFCLHQACALKPDNPYYQSNLSSALSDLGRYQEAIKHARLAIKHHKTRQPAPGRIWTWLAERNLIRALMGHGRDTLEVSHLEEARQLSQTILDNTDDPLYQAKEYFNLARQGALLGHGIEAVLPLLAHSIALDDKHRTASWREEDFQAYWSDSRFRQALGSSQPATAQAFRGDQLTIKSRQGCVRPKIEEALRLSLKDEDQLVLFADRDEPWILSHRPGKGTWCVDAASFCWVDRLGRRKPDKPAALGALLLSKAGTSSLQPGQVKAWRPVHGEDPMVPLQAPHPSLVLTTRRGLLELQNKKAAWEKVQDVIQHPSRLFEEVRFRGGKALVFCPCQGPDGHRAWWGCDGQGRPGLLSLDFGVL